MTDSPADAIALVLALLTGPLATAIATIAVAGVGLGLLGGHLAWRRAARVALGCALVFGAGGVAGGLLGLTPAAGTPDMAVEASTPPPPPAPPALAVAGAQPLANAYMAARQAVGIRFPAAAGTVRLTAQLAPDGHIERLDAHGEGLDPAVLATVSQIVSASGVMFPPGSPSTDLPPLAIGRLAP